MKKKYKKYKMNNINELTKNICDLNLIKSNEQTKEWRKKQNWYSLGCKKNNCELHQIKQIKKITNTIITTKTYLRFNIYNYTLVKKIKPNIYENGYEFTEDIDGLYKINDIILYYNLKMVCNQGGSQTRTLRESYHFINCQLNYVLNNNNCYFINNLSLPFFFHFICR